MRLTKNRYRGFEGAILKFGDYYAIEVYGGDGKKIRLIPFHKLNDRIFNRKNKLQLSKTSIFDYKYSAVKYAPIFYKNKIEKEKFWLNM